MPARSPLTAATRQRSRRPARHVVCPIVTPFFDSFFAMTDRHIVIRLFVLSQAVWDWVNLRFMATNYNAISLFTNDKNT